MIYRAHIDGTLGYTFDIAAWNNAPDQTAENVALTLEFAALCEEQREALGSSAAGSQSPGAVRPRTEALTVL